MQGFKYSFVGKCDHHEMYLPCLLANEYSYEVLSLLIGRQNENNSDRVSFILCCCHSVAVFSANIICLARLSDTSFTVWYNNNIWYLQFDISLIFDSFQSTY